MLNINYGLEEQSRESLLSIRITALGNCEKVGNIGHRKISLFELNKSIFQSKSEDN
jgi:hypothetical protein